ncbi:MAG: hypothetical protein ACE5I1_32050, partial [bacterium]
MFEACVHVFSLSGCSYRLAVNGHILANLRENSKRIASNIVFPVKQIVRPIIVNAGGLGETFYDKGVTTKICFLFVGRYERFSSASQAG